MKTRERRKVEDVFPGRDKWEERVPEKENELLNDPFFQKRFHTICHFASGGMGDISKAKDLVFDRIVAVKTLKEEFKNDAEQRSAFLRECRFHAQLDHPAIVPIYAMGTSDEGGLSLAMKYINGVTLKEYILSEREKSRSRRLYGGNEAGLRSRLEYFLRICEAVAYCHSMQVIHGDLKPENIFLGPFGELYVMDWGCARSEGTRPRHAAGTLNYLPPEFLREKIAAPSLDIFALGMILFELSSLRRARNHTSSPGKENFSIYDKRSYYFYPGKVPLPARLKAIILKAVAVKKEERYASCEELMRDVRGFIFNGNVAAWKESLPEKSLRFLRNHPLFTLSLIFLLLFFLSSGWLLTLLYHTRMEEEKKREVIRRTQLISSVHLLSLPVAKDLLRAKAKLLILTDHAVMSRYLTGDWKESDRGKTFLPLPRLETFREIVEKVEKYEKSLFSPGKKAWEKPLFLPFYVVKSMGVYWENGSLYRKSADNTEQKFFLPPPFPTLPGVVSWGDPFILPEGDCIFFCRTSLYGNEGQFFGQSFLELDLKKILSPVFRFKKRFPEYKIYFIPGNGNLLCVGERALSFLDEDSENPFYNGKIIRNILEKLNGSGRPLMKLFLNGGRCYAAAASLPVAEAFLLLLIEEKVIRKDFDGSFPGFYDGKKEKSFSYQIF